MFDYILQEVDSIKAFRTNENKILLRLGNLVLPPQRANRIRLMFELRATFWTPSMDERAFEI